MKRFFFFLLVLASVPAPLVLAQRSIWPLWVDKKPQQRQRKKVTSYPKGGWEQRGGQAPLPPVNSPSPEDPDSVEAYQSAEAGVTRVAAADPIVFFYYWDSRSRRYRRYRWRDNLSSLKGYVQQEVKNLLRDNNFRLVTGVSGADAAAMDQVAAEIAVQNSPEGQLGRGRKREGFFSGTDYLAVSKVSIKTQERIVLGGSRRRNGGAVAFEGVTVEIDVAVVGVLNREEIAQGQGTGSARPLTAVFGSVRGVGGGWERREVPFMGAVKEALAQVASDFERSN